MTRGQRRLRATLALTGTIIGAGIFGVPAMVGAWGVPVATLGFIILTLVVLAVHLFLAEAVSSYQPDVRLPGFAGRWVGSWGRWTVGIAQPLAVFGSSLAYVILGGEFLAILGAMAGITMPLLVWQVLFWAAGAGVILAGFSWMMRVEAFLTWGLVGLLLLMTGVAFFRVDPAWVFTFPQTGTFLPYGVILFSLFGFTTIPELELMVRGNREDLRRAVIRGTVGSAVLTYLFGIAVWLASSGTVGAGPAALLAVFPPIFSVIIPLFGLLAVITSYMTMGYDLGSLFRLDYRISAFLAWLVALGVPLALLFLTNRNFLSTIGLVGAVFDAVIAVVCVLIGRAALRHRRPWAPRWSAIWWWREVASVAVVGFLIVGGATWLLV
jgi:amino acid permease